MHVVDTLKSWPGRHAGSGADPESVPVAVGSDGAGAESTGSGAGGMGSQLGYALVPSGHVVIGAGAPATGGAAAATAAIPGVDVDPPHAVRNSMMARSAMSDQRIALTVRNSVSVVMSGPLNEKGDGGLAPSQGDAVWRQWGLSTTRATVAR